MSEEERMINKDFLLSVAQLFVREVSGCSSTEELIEELGDFLLMAFSIAGIPEEDVGYFLENIQRGYRGPFPEEYLQMLNIYI